MTTYIYASAVIMNYELCIVNCELITKATSSDKFAE